MRTLKPLGPLLYTALLITLGFAGSGVARAAEVIRNGSNAISIVNLFLADESGDGQWYRVDFLYASANDLYGDFVVPNFDVRNGDQFAAEALRNIVLAALNEEPEVTTVGPENGPTSTVWAIGWDKEGDFTEVVEGLYSSGSWVEGTVDVRPETADDMYAKFTETDEPTPTPDPPADAALDFDVTGVVDISNDTVPDIAYLTYTDKPVVRYYSGADGQKIKGVGYCTDSLGIAAATVADSNGNGVANDPGVAVLCVRRSGGNISTAVETRRSSNGSFINGFPFLDASWYAIDVAVIDDMNGDGVTGDTGIAVLAIAPDGPPDQKIRVQVRRLSDGTLFGNLTYLDDEWRPIALDVSNRAGKEVIIGVLATKPENGNNKIEARKLSNGQSQLLQAVWDSNWRARDIAVLKDMNGNGVADDQAWLVLAYNPNRGNKVQARMVSGGAWVKNLFFRGAKWYLTAIAATDDISGNLVEEVASMGKKPDERIVAIDVVDYATDTKTISFEPQPE